MKLLQVIGASTDSHYSHLAWTLQDRKEGGVGPVTFPLLADKSMKIAKTYGVLNPDTGVPFRGLFIIDSNGNLRHMSYNDTMVTRDLDEVIRLVQAYQFCDTNGEVCPMGWRPGGKSFKNNYKEAREYFQSVN